MLLNSVKFINIKIINNPITFSDLEHFSCSPLKFIKYNSIFGNSTFYQYHNLPTSQYKLSILQRSYMATSSGNQFTIITKAEVQQLLEQNSTSEKKAIIIDVREDIEVKETGTVPTANHAPIKQLIPFMLAPPEEFKEKFGFNKPEKDDTLVFYCKMGGRAKAISEYVSSLGYTNVKNYSGGMMDWLKNDKN